jgi:hypothetical protein
MVLLSAQGMDAAGSAAVPFTGPDRVRDVLHSFNTDGFDSLRPRYAGGRPPKFDLAQRAEIKKIALGRPAGHGLPFSTWSLSKLAAFLVAEGWSRTSPTRSCACCCASRVSPFQAVMTWKISTDPDYEAKKNRVLALYAIADGKVEPGPGPGDPTVVICLDESGPLNLQPHRGRQWAPTSTGTGDPVRPRRRRRRATFLRPPGIRHQLGRPRPVHRSALRTRDDPQDPHRVPGLGGGDRRGALDLHPGGVEADPRPDVADVLGELTPGLVGAVLAADVVRVLDDVIQPFPTFSEAFCTHCSCPTTQWGQLAGRGVFCN